MHLLPRQLLCVAKLLVQVSHVLLKVESGLGLSLLLGFLLERLFRRLLGRLLVRFEAGTGGVAWEEARDAEPFFVLVELKHFEHVFAVGQFVLELLKPREVRLEDCALHIDLMLDLVQPLFFFVKNSFFLQNLFPFCAESLRSVLDSLSQVLKLGPLLGELNNSLPKRFMVSFQ